jgi:hypothetical protein
MARFLSQRAALLLCLVVADCGGARQHYGYLDTADCGAPNLYKFHGARVAMTATNPLTPDLVRHWADGCAIVSFTLNDVGQITDPSVVLERPPGQGIGANAIAVLSSDFLVPQSEARFDTLAPGGPALRYAMTVGFGHVEGRLTIAKRTVPNHQTIHLSR